MKRIEWVDDVKGTAITLIVAGHVVATLSNMTTDGPQAALRCAFDTIYSFHVPLFFAIAGLTFSVHADFGSFVKRKFLRLMVPYYVWGVGSALLAITLGLNVANDMQALATTTSYAGKTMDSQWFVPFLSIIHGGGWPNGRGFWFNGVLWFLPVMFVVELIYYWVDKACNGRVSLVFCSFALALLFQLYWSPMTNQLADVKGIYLPFNLAWVPKFLPFVAIGHWFSLRFIRKQVDEDRNSLTYRLIACVVVAYIAIVYFCPSLGMYRWDRPNVNLSVYYIKWFLKAILGIVALMALSRLKGLSIFAFLAPTSLGIMLSHKFPLVAAQLVIGHLAVLPKLGTVTVCLIAILLTIVLTLGCHVLSLLIARYVPWCLGIGRRCFSQ